MSSWVSGALSTLPLWFWRWEVEVVGDEGLCEPHSGEQQAWKCPFPSFYSPQRHFMTFFMCLSSLVPWFMGLRNAKKKRKFCYYAQTANDSEMSSATTSVPRGHRTGNWLIWMPPSASEPSFHCCSRRAANLGSGPPSWQSSLRPRWSTACESDLRLATVEAIGYRRRGWAAESDRSTPSPPLPPPPTTQPLTITNCGV